MHAPGRGDLADQLRMLHTALTFGLIGIIIILIGFSLLNYIFLLLGTNDEKYVQNGDKLLHVSKRT